MARDYAMEYRRYHSSPKAKKHRAMRNKARRMMAREGRVHKGDGKAVDHKVPLSKGGSNRRGNLRVVSKHANLVKGDR